MLKRPKQFHQHHHTHQRYHKILFELLFKQLKVQIFLNSIAPDPETQKFLGPLGYSREINNYEINLRDMLNSISLLSNPHLDATSENDADFSIGLKEIAINGDIALARLNEDSTDDVFVFTQHDSSKIEGMLLLSN